MIRGYVISGEFNDSEMYDSEDPNLPICKKCGYKTDYEYISPYFRLTKKVYDVSVTYDGHIIVSQKFKDFCVKKKYQGLEFKELPNGKNFFSFFIRNILPFDTESTNLSFDNYCNICGNYESVTPGIPLVIKDLNSAIAKGFYATDIKFASGNEKNSIYFVGIKTYEEMRKEKFKGIHFLKFDTERSVPWESREQADE